MIKNVKGRSSRTALEQLLVKTFKAADINGNGTLEAEEFATCLRGIQGVGLTDPVIEIMWRVSIAAGGRVSGKETPPCQTAPRRSKIRGRIRRRKGLRA